MGVAGEEAMQLKPRWPPLAGALCLHLLHCVLTLLGIVGQSRERRGSCPLQHRLEVPGDARTGRQEHGEEEGEKIPSLQEGGTEEEEERESQHSVPTLASWSTEPAHLQHRAAAWVLVPRQLPQHLAVQLALQLVVPQASADHVLDSCNVTVEGQGTERSGDKQLHTLETGREQGGRERGSELSPHTQG